jgi:hypothetical protein
MYGCADLAVRGVCRESDRWAPPCWRALSLCGQAVSRSCLCQGPPPCACCPNRPSPPRAGHLSPRRVSPSWAGASTACFQVTRSQTQILRRPHAWQRLFLATACEIAVDATVYSRITIGACTAIRSHATRAKAPCATPQHAGAKGAVPDQVLAQCACSAGVASTQPKAGERASRGANQRGARSCSERDFPGQLPQGALARSSADRPCQSLPDRPCRTLRFGFCAAQREDSSAGPKFAAGARRRCGRGCVDRAFVPRWPGLRAASSRTEGSLAAPSLALTRSLPARRSVAVWQALGAIPDCHLRRPL